MRAKLRLSERSCTFPINKSWSRAQNALHTATALHFLSLPEVKPSIACCDDSFPKLQLSYHNGRWPLIFTHVFSPPLLSFILFQLKCDSLWWSFVRVHQPQSSSSPNPAPKTSVTIFYFKPWYLVLSFHWMCLQLPETAFRRALLCQVLYNHNETFPQELHFKKVFQSFNDTPFLSFFFCFSCWCLHESISLAANLAFAAIAANWIVLLEPAELLRIYTSGN